ncbi:class I SAM-dependent methyltransferase [Mangrovivirga sp. M17]|uniref:Class I SAM-dependent methyltransferase n=1 Tax=Mangrovivirga halotolerans TaxID=2993936 RepID=A0ABT3RWM0_9BACT|nr:class I SAM-dependent methyltransferase [Mangrovivirga halotolerans]MCX2745926.1 class I SAM-dependent methyltransferase [Mangrovivirga halotolerans]
MDKVINSYDHIASIYDRLGKLVFGGSLIKPQIEILNSYKGKDILIVGAGTGNVLKTFEANQFNSIDLFDISKPMLNEFNDLVISKSSNINYFLKDGRTGDLNKHYDLIMFPFFLDHFDEQEIREILVSYRSEIPTFDDLAIIDFTNPLKFKHRILAKTMLLFFRITTGHTLNRIPDIFRVSDEILKGLKKKDKYYYDSFIKSSVYSRL